MQRSELRDGAARSLKASSLMMTTMPPTPCTAEVNETIGKLCVGGDWACAHGDFSGLRYVARRLASNAPERIQGQLAELIAACSAAPERAAVLWASTKSQLHRG
jgi:hypothetical protein